MRRFMAAFLTLLLIANGCGTNRREAPTLFITAEPTPTDLRARLWDHVYVATAISFETPMVAGPSPQADWMDDYLAWLDAFFQYTNVFREAVRHSPETGHTEINAAVAQTLYEERTADLRPYGGPAVFRPVVGTFMDAYKHCHLATEYYSRLFSGSVLSNGDLVSLSSELTNCQALLSAGGRQLYQQP